MTGFDASTAAMHAARHRLCDPRLTHDETVFALAAALGQTTADPLRAALDEWSRPLFGCAGAELDEQAALIVACLTDGLGLHASSGCDGRMLLHEALRDGATHPTLLAVLGHELARRAGLHSVVAWSPSGHWTLLIDRGTFLPIGCGPESPSSGYELQACCAHQVAHEMLGVLAGDARPFVSGRALALSASLEQACAAAARAPRHGV